jgi:hypothetical protein
MSIRILFLLIIFPFILNAQSFPEFSMYFRGDINDILTSAIKTDIKEVKFYITFSEKSFKAKKNGKLINSYINIDTMRFIKENDSTFSEILFGDTTILYVTENNIEIIDCNDDSFLSRKPKVKEFDSLNYQVVIWENEYNFSKFMHDTITENTYHLTYFKDNPAKRSLWVTEINKSITTETKYNIELQDTIPFQKNISIVHNDSFKEEKIYYYNKNKIYNRPCCVTTEKKRTFSDSILIYTVVKSNDKFCDSNFGYIEYQEITTIQYNSEKQIQQIIMYAIEPIDKKHFRTNTKQLIVEYMY